MITDYRKAVLAIIIAVLFTFFVQATVDAFISQPDYQDYCGELDRPNRMNVSEAEFEEYREQEEACTAKLNEARDEYNMVLFLISTVAAVIAIIAALSIPVNKNIGVTISTGILLGGLITLFIGTIRGWSGLDEIIRPVVLLAELLLVIYLGYKTLGDNSKLISKNKK